MGGYIARRLVLLVITLWGVLTLVFFISRVIPGDPARLAAGIRAKPEQVEQLRRELGLDRPLIEQYWHYIRNAVRGNLGTSIRTRRPVSTDLAEYFPATLELTIFAMILCLIIGLPLGIVSAVRQGTLIDRLTGFATISAISMPPFWLGLLLQLIFFSWLKVFPAMGRLSIYLSPPKHVTGLYLLDSFFSRNWMALKDSLMHLILPGMALAAGTLAVISRMTRGSLLEVLELDYVRTARSKGLPESIVLLRHALRNALLPIITSTGLQFGVLLAGAVPVEVVFTWPGIGLYAFRSIVFADFPAILGVTLIMAIIYALLNLIVDLLYTVVDPRIRY